MLTSSCQEALPQHSFSLEQERKKAENEAHRQTAAFHPQQFIPSKKRENLIPQQTRGAAALLAPCGAPGAMGHNPWEQQGSVGLVWAVSLWDINFLQLFGKGHLQMHQHQWNKTVLQPQCSPMGDASLDFLFCTQKSSFPPFSQQIKNSTHTSNPSAARRREKWENGGEEGRLCSEARGVV